MIAAAVADDDDRAIFLGRRDRGRRRLRAQALGDAAQRRLQALALDRLGEVVDGFEVERLERVLGVRGDEDDRRRRRAQAQLGGELGAVAAGHLHVEQQQVAAARRQPDERLGRVRGLADDDRARLAALADEALQAQSRELFVVDDEHAQR